LAAGGRRTSPGAGPTATTYLQQTILGAAGLGVGSPGADSGALPMRSLLLLAAGVVAAVSGAVELGRSRGIRGREEDRLALVGCGWHSSATAGQSSCDGLRETGRGGGVLQLTLHCAWDDQGDEDEAIACFKSRSRQAAGLHAQGGPARPAHRRVAIKARGMSATRSWTRLAGKQPGGGPGVKRGSTAMRS
jgi:hypothetical protein